MRRVCILFTLALIAVYAVAAAVQEESSKQAAIIDGNNADDDDYYDDDDYDYSAQDKKGHKHKHKNKLFLFAGGLKSLAAFIAIKVKIILVVITVIGIIGFTLKVFGALKYAGYIGGGGGCPVIHEPAYGLGYSVTPPRPAPDHGHEYEPSYGGGSDWSSTGSYARSLVQSYIDTEFVSHALKNMDIAEMVFATLDMDDEQCRRRLVCEIDAKTRQIPFLSYAMEFFSRGFEKYRTSGEKKYKECAKLYSDCDDSEESRRRRRRRRRKRSVEEDKLYKSLDIPT